ncbi:SRPBCC family protein [uncultured Kordia sp.]|uniref:SRPBCC family protein n=1 Tax=uncultured Kordia sp. TaxID=507699 RepID=UPI002612DACC|nr:SRPBCC family protein [uncultured Kordia sp.]
MKILKYSLLLLLVVLVAGAIYVATRPSDYDVVRSKVIKAPIHMVFNNVNDFKNWEKWGPWHETDTTIVVTYNEQTSGVGANYSWTSKDGPGKMKTVSLTQNKSIEQVLQFADYSPTDVYWNFEEVPEGTKVSWGMKNDKTEFVFKIFAILGGGMDKMLGDMEVIGLDNIEREVLAELEKNPPQTFRLGEVSQQDATAKQFIGYYQEMSTEASLEEMSKLFMQNMPKAGQYAAVNKLENYVPGSLYTKWDEETKEAEFYIGLLVDSQDALPKADGMITTPMSAGKIVKISKFGQYGVGDMEAHGKIAKYMAENNLVPVGHVWELYVNDPMSVKPSAIQTDIYYAVKTAE